MIGVTLSHTSEIKPRYKLIWINIVSLILPKRPTQISESLSSMQAPQWVSTFELLLTDEWGRIGAMSDIQGGAPVRPPPSLSEPSAAAISLGSALILGNALSLRPSLGPSDHNSCHCRSDRQTSFMETSVLCVTNPSPTAKRSIRVGRCFHWLIWGIER